MPRQHIYMSQKTLDGIRQIVAQRRESGATSSEANISSVAAELLAIGLRVTEQINKKSSSETQESSDESYKKYLLSEVVKARQASQAILKYMYSLDEIKSDPRFDFKELKSIFENELKVIKEECFD
ncbi:conjugal transfer protein TraM [Citrobacter freundii]|nr:conjugal transfer protein TraM [Citrobacter freundii]